MLFAISSKLNEQGEINSTLTRQDIASFAGTTYETLFKLTNELIAQKILDVSGKNIRILNEEKLRSMIKQPIQILNS